MKICGNIAIQIKANGLVFLKYQIDTWEMNSLTNDIG